VQQRHHTHTRFRTLSRRIIYALFSLSVVCFAPDPTGAPSLDPAGKLSFQTPNLPILFALSLATENRETTLSLHRQQKTKFNCNTYVTYRNKRNKIEQISAYNSDNTSQ